MNFHEQDKFVPFLLFGSTAQNEFMNTQTNTLHSRHKFTWACWLNFAILAATGLIMLLVLGLDLSKQAGDAYVTTNQMGSLIGSVTCLFVASLAFPRFRRADE